MKSVKGGPPINDTLLRRNCPVCGQRFKTLYGRNLHITKTMLPDHLQWKAKNEWGAGHVNRGYRG